MNKSDIGLIGLGTMGAMLSLNIAEKGFAISVFNRTVARVDSFVKGAGSLASQITPARSLDEFVDTIAAPRAIIVMVPAGEAVDAQIAALRPLLNSDDLIIDAGNANFHDTNRRAAEATAVGASYLGIGVSGGEDGARHGPSIMGGGDRSNWGRVAHIFDAIAAKYQGKPCATWMGPGGAGHLVKTVHNGIEYADMQLIAEAYGVMRDGMNMTAPECGTVFGRWNRGILKSYLTEISAEVSNATDPTTGSPVLDIILDRAGQKGTGRWTVIESQQTGAPVPVIEAAVAARNMSAELTTRHVGEDLFGGVPQVLDRESLTLDDLEAALIVGKIMCYAQGFALLARVGTAHGWELPMSAIAETWREGCIIRSAMLNDMATALGEDPGRNLMFAPYFADLLRRNQAALRNVAAVAVAHGLPVPAMSAALGYFDTMRSARTTANMIQAQRDFFGAHSFERIDAQGSHHGPWGKA
ncbi:MAG: NADP-dependent phosphogluconate dehydrogenase [Paracoccaceae bacterium]|nr:NADP-dependent phosphogluconate dehydrogenase [Paracoccaceae bacterium]MDE2914632.1 NADP-dependent phosphogluconate dehydrogenase [Paracoccaceae bacterium]